MGIISLEKSQHMYWLGRYVERVFTTLRTYIYCYDQMLDEDQSKYRDFCKNLNIPDNYGSQKVFTENYLFDDKDISSIASSLQRAFDNAIVLRDEISSDSLSYIHMAMDTLASSKFSQNRLIDLQQIMDDLYAFWGSVDDCTESELCRNLMKWGRYQERLDLYIRLNYKKEEIEKTYCKLKKRIENSGIAYPTDELKFVEECVYDERPLRKKRQKLLECLARLGG